MIRVTGIDAILRQLDNYVNSMQYKQHKVLQKLAEIGIDVATVRFGSAQYDGTNDVTVSQPIWDGDNKVLFSADGDTVAFIEFGTGVHYSEAHPKAVEFGAVRGTYGYGLGRFDSWRYEGDPGTNGEVIQSGAHAGEVLTHGNPPARAMYEAGKEMRSRISEIIKEVYGK